MRPIKLSLENFGPYRERSDIDFSVLGDFFLICGKTGSGKSTLFDAMTYALYGKAPGARRNHETNLVSNFAEPGDKPFVGFEFELSGCRYRVERTPPYSRQKRGGGLAAVPPSATMSRLAAVWEVLEEGQDKVTERVEHLIGLRADEFAKVILLPQGEFQSFLEMNSKSRSEILEKLFPVDIHARVTELAKKKSDEARIRVQNIDGQIEELAGGLGEKPEERLAALTESEKAAAQREQEALEAVKEAQRRCDAALNLLERLKKVKRAFDEVVALEARKDDEAERSRKIAAAKASARVMPFVETFDRVEAAAQEAEALAQGAEAALHAHGSRAGEVAGWHDRLSALAGLIKDAQEQEIRLRGRVEKWSARQSALTALDKAQSVAAAADEMFRNKTETLAALENTLSNLRPDPAEVLRLRAEGDALHGLQGGLLRLEAKTERRAELEKELKSRAAAIDTCARASAAAEGGARRAKERQSLLSERQEQAEAAHLARGLCDGEPCPVCGSLQHPSPALPPSEGLSMGDISRAELDAAAEEATKALMSLASADAALVSARQRLAESEKAVALVEAEIAALRSGQAELDQWLGADTVAASRARLDAALRRNREAMNVLDLRAQEAERTEAALALARGEQEAFRSAAEDGRAEVLACHARLQAAEADSGTTDPGDAYGQACSRTVALTKERDSLEKASQDWERKEAELKARRAALAGAAESAKASVLQEAPRMLDALVEAEFLQASESLAATQDISRARDLARALALPADRLAAEEKLEAAYKRELTAAVAVADALGNSLADGGDVAGLAVSRPENAVSLPGVAGVNRGSGRGISTDLSRGLNTDSGPDSAAESALRWQREISVWEDKAEDERRALGLANEDLARARAAAEGVRSDAQRLREGVARLDAKKREREKVVGDSRGLYALQALLSGDIEGKRLPFKNYVLGLYFGEVVLRASNHLSQMSDGRFYLKQESAASSRLAKTGLGVSVLDSWTGTERPTETLSGGEKFLTSISLALGLADSIRERSGGVALDSVFIDEGFGSLDDEALEKAIAVLNRIRGTRTIGIISHVADLRSRIPARIEVEKSPSGSRLRVVAVPDQAE